MKTRTILSGASLLCASALWAGDIIIENASFRLAVGEDAIVKSLKIKETGEECLTGAREQIALFTVTQDRPFNNEIKLIHPNKRTVYPATSLKREGNVLIAGFDHKQYKARVTVKEAPGYVVLELTDFDCNRATSYDYLRMDIPPVSEFRVAQLPVTNRKNFGDWLNASWDDKAAIAVVATSPYADIDHENRPGWKLLTADLIRGRKLRGGSAAIIAAAGREKFLDGMDALEQDYNLPRGVKSRRSKAVNASIFHTSGSVPPSIVDRLLVYIKKGGFKYMTYNYSMIVEENGPWSWCRCGDYDWHTSLYPNKEADLAKVLARIKAAGVTPGLHTMHSHVGLKSRYVTPVADVRLNKTRRFTLKSSLPLYGEVKEIEVYETTADVTMFPACRVLQFGGELFSYEKYTTEPPYRFLGVKRGAYATKSAAHPAGEVGGILDISEFGTPGSCYIDQNTDLQDEIAAKIAAIYNCGFEYVYLDGSEGVNAPFNFHVSNGQYRQWKLFKPEPLFGEGAAKTHFGWHMLGGANAFDCFGPDIFKEKLIEYPFAQAPITWQDMTRCNFGWWHFYLPKKDPTLSNASGTQADMWEFGQSVSVAWKCPMTVSVSFEALEKHPRTADILEAMRRWEEVREKDLMTPAWREEILRDYHQEHHLLKAADGSYKLVRCRQIPVGKGKNHIRAFLFEADGAAWVTYWHAAGKGSVIVPVKAGEVSLYDEYAGKAVATAVAGEGKVSLPAEGRLYLKSTLSASALEAAFAQAEVK